MNAPTRPRSIKIIPVLNGFLVEVGCQAVVAKSTNELASQIQRYYENPASVEAEFIKNAVNKTMDVPGVTREPEYAADRGVCGQERNPNEAIRDRLGHVMEPHPAFQEVPSPVPVCDPVAPVSTLRRSL